MAAARVWNSLKWFYFNKEPRLYRKKQEAQLIVEGPRDAPCQLKPSVRIMQTDACQPRQRLVVIYTATCIVLYTRR